METLELKINDLDPVMRGGKHVKLASMNLSFSPPGHSGTALPSFRFYEIRSDRHWPPLLLTSRHVRGATCVPFAVR
ncbi:hypothetical protein [Nitrobacter sp.]|uniref:hypothetical protein n=1 Tax=Nitrobacter sp. TaxID=29420 RepID=UPI0029CAC4A5|nr:hypothetical protein [Nitrobacter sp.]